jgi:hypothetical protein
MRRVEAISPIMAFRGRDSETGAGHVGVVPRIAGQMDAVVY